MTARRLAVGAAIGLAVALGVWLARPRPSTGARGGAAPPANAPALTTATGETMRAQIVEALQSARLGEPPIGPPPASLRDTDIDGSLAVDADGHLLVTPALIRFFEYFFAASGEEPPDRIRDRVTAQITNRLSGDARRAALDVLDRYVTYRERSQRLAEQEDDSGNLTATYDSVRGLRRECFGEADAAALFGEEEATLAVTIAQRNVEADPSLSDEQRAARLAALDAQLPESVRAARDAIGAFRRFVEDEAALHNAGGSPQELQALRERDVGAAAAARLAELDQRRAAWQARLDAYRQDRAAIDADPALDDVQRDAARDAVRARHFTEAELARVRALDRIQ